MNTVHNKTVLVEIDDASHEQHIEKIEKWLGNVVKLQLSLSGLIKKAEASLEEPHIKEAIGKIAEAEKCMNHRRINCCKFLVKIRLLSRML